MTGDFVDGSSATGVLAIVNSRMNTYYYLIRSDKLTLQESLSGVVGGEYFVSVFLVEEDEMPFERAASKPRAVSVANSEFQVRKYSLLSTYIHCVIR